jgi:catechol 2,3-dioxygenase-like lactoylglutathione lyase family enzyme
MSEVATSILALRGVDHTARPTWKLKETIEFYRDKLGLPLIHVISARGWGPSTHPDFLHFFFDSGRGSAIAFFYYLGSSEPASLHGRDQHPPVPDDHVFDATHTAWQVESAAELSAWKRRLEEQGLNVSVETRHEVIESIYVRDPNGYFVEFTRKLRQLGPLDATDARLTLDAALAAESSAALEGRRVSSIDEVWARKADLMEGETSQASTAGVRIYVPQLAEFASLVRNASDRRDCRVVPMAGYDRIETDQSIEFLRSDLNLKPAVWYGLFTGGLHGRIEVLNRDRVVIAPLVH